MNCQVYKNKNFITFITTSNDGPLHIEEEIDRKLFESLSEELLDRLLEPVQIALEDSGWDADDIDEVVSRWKYSDTNGSTTCKNSCSK